MTLRECCACGTICAWPLANVLQLPQHLHLRVRKSCGCHGFGTQQFHSNAICKPRDLASQSAAPVTSSEAIGYKVLRLPRNLHLIRLPKCCACHTMCTSDPYARAGHWGTSQTAANPRRTRGVPAAYLRANPCAEQR